MKIGLLRETKSQAEKRVALLPHHCKKIVQEFPQVTLVVQSSSHRCIKDEDYANAGIPVVDSVADCDALIGIKEVAIDSLIPGKTYIFYSHTIKKQPYNMPLLKAILDKKIRLIDYECLAFKTGFRALGFGHWAGMVGVHNAIYTWGKRMAKFDYPRLYKFHTWAQAQVESLKNLDLKGVRIVLTGHGRVGAGAVEMLNAIGVNKVSPEEFLNLPDNPEEGAIYCQLLPHHFFAKSSHPTWDEGFFNDPCDYHSIIGPYLSKADILVNGIYWDKRCAPLFTLTEMQSSDFRIQVIADITCDIAPDSSIPSTIRPSTTESPVYGFDPTTGKECPPFTGPLDVMAVDCLPGEMPVDASSSFGDSMVEHVLPELLCNGDMTTQATITDNGNLTNKFSYLGE